MLTVPLAGSPLPADFIPALDRARGLAIKTARADFSVMSVALSRTPPEPKWHFRFYGEQDVIVSVTISADGYRLVGHDVEHDPKAPADA